MVVRTRDVKDWERDYGRNELGDGGSEQPVTRYQRSRRLEEMKRLFPRLPPSVTPTVPPRPAGCAYQPQRKRCDILTIIG